MIAIASTAGANQRTEVLILIEQFISASSHSSGSSASSHSSGSGKIPLNWLSFKNNASVAHQDPMPIETPLYHARLQRRPLPLEIGRAIPRRGRHSSSRQTHSIRSFVALLAAELIIHTKPNDVAREIRSPRCHGDSRRHVSENNICCCHCPCRIADAAKIKVQIFAL